MLVCDVYLQRSQGKQETDAKERKEEKEIVGNRSCGHSNGAEAAGWQTEGM